MKRFSICLMIVLILFTFATVPISTAATASFGNMSSIAIPSSGTASPYPSDIAVSGLTGLIETITVTLTNMTHTYPDDIEILLVGPGGQNLILMSDAGDGLDINSVTLTFDDAAASPLPDNSQIVSGTFRPTNYGAGDTFAAPAPAPSGAIALSTFSGTDPNGTWSLYVVDDAGADAGSIADGWSITITARTPASIPTLSEWGMIIMSLLLAGSAIWMIQRRQLS